MPTERIPENLLSTKSTDWGKNHSEFPYGALYTSSTFCCHFEISFTGLFNFVNRISQGRLDEKLKFYHLSETIFNTEPIPGIGPFLSGLTKHAYF